MPTVEKLRNRLIEKLKELFHLDQPDLDFGFYRIMHAKAKQVIEFLENDLLETVETAFGESGEQRIAALRKGYEDTRAKAKKSEATDSEETEPIKKAKAALDAAADTSKAEAEVYDHLFRFFERYYEDGDFISRRYYRRETDSQHPPFGIPYHGEEVKLHWTNADQYYIKTAEHFSNFTFDLTKAKEVAANKLERFGEDEPAPMRVHFRIVEANEGEHGNVKANEQTKRYFIIHDPDPVILEDDRLVVCFEFRPDPDKTGREGTWRDKRNAESVEAVLTRLEQLAGDDATAADYLRLLETPAPTEKHKNRPLLARYVNEYTARNTMDYFIHKNLGGFLRRELDFYIKNEVMRLDDIESADAPQVEQYIARLKVLRQIAGKLIDFLAQLEDFQKKLWLKKKFITETHYLISLDRILAIDDTSSREALTECIRDNEAQRQEWITLFAIDAIHGDTHSAAYSDPLTIAFLSENPHLIVDTRHFDAAFVERVLPQMGNFTEASTGLLVHGDNSQALTLLSKSLRGQVSCAYLDPPFNTTETGFIYKNEYRHSSWCSMMSTCLARAWRLLHTTGVVAIAIDDSELHHLGFVCDGCFGIESRLGVLVVEIKPSGRTNDNYLATCHEYYLLYARDAKAAQITFFPLTARQTEQYAENDGDGAFKWRDFLRTGGLSTPEERPNSCYPIYYDPVSKQVSLEKHSDCGVIWPVDAEGRRRVWRKTPPAFEKHLAAGEIQVSKKRDGSYKVQIIDRIKSGTRPKSVWIGKHYDAASHGTKLLKSMFGEAGVFTFPKSVHATRDVLYVTTGEGDGGWVLDFFAGSGTTGDAVLRLNREDDGKRRFVLVEQGKYFDTALTPRIKKAAYATEWRDGKPKTRDSGISQLVTSIRLESYEDCLNGLVLKDSLRENESLSCDKGMREDFMLHYMLDVETRGSQSLLNIEAFADPTAYKLRERKPGSDEDEEKNVDLLGTFNYLLGLRVEQFAAPKTFSAAFKREPDPELPEDQDTRLVIDGHLRQSADGPWWFRTVEGWIPRDFENPNNGRREKVLIVWRKCPKLVEMGPKGLEYDNAVLDAWFEANRIHPREKYDFDVIYVNCSNNLPNLALDDETWRVRLIEEDFHKLMWDVDDV